MPKLRDLDEDFLICRMLRGHSFDLVNVNELQVKRPTWGWAQGFRCRRCGMERLDVWDRRGNLAYRRYIPPAEYKVESKTRVSVTDYRREFMRRSA